MTSKATVIDSVYSNRKSKLGGGNPNVDDSTQGRDLIEEAFSSN